MSLHCATKVCNLRAASVVVSEALVNEKGLEVRFFDEPASVLVVPDDAYFENGRSLGEKVDGHLLGPLGIGFDGVPVGG